MASLTVIIPTYSTGRPLERCIASFRDQLAPGDEAIILGDTREGPLPHVEALVERLGQPFRYLPHNVGKMDWAHGNLNYAMTQARGDYLTWTDDDDVYTPYAFAVIRDAIGQLPAPSPIIFRFKTAYGYIVPPHQTFETGEIAQGHISGQCLVVPNIPARFGVWGAVYEGDFQLITSTLAKWDGTPIAFVDEVIGIGRPG